MAKVIMIILIVLEFVNNAVKHGEPKGEILGHYNIYISLLDTITIIGLLYWGGFFK